MQGAGVPAQRATVPSPEDGMRSIPFVAGFVRIIRRIGTPRGAGCGCHGLAAVVAHGDWPSGAPRRLDRSLGCAHRHRFATRTEARLKIATWITSFYNTRRRHSAASGLPPAEFERIISEARASRHQEDLAA